MLVVVNHGWQSEATAGLTGDWSLSHSFSDHLPTYLPTYRPTYLPTHVPTYLSTELRIHPSIYSSIRLFIYPSISVAIYLSTYPSMNLSIYPSIYLFIHLSVYHWVQLSNYLSIYPSVYPSVYLSTYLSVYLTIYLLCYQLQILGLLRGSQFSDSADTVMQRITTASKRSRAMNYRCCCAIVRSEQTHTLATTLTGNRLTLQLQACNELRLLPRDHVQWITAAAASSCMQWITATAAPSCGQKKHTRWRSTPTLRNDHVQWITAACNELQLLLRHRAVRKNTHATKLEL